MRRFWEDESFSHGGSRLIQGIRVRWDPPATKPSVRTLWVRFYWQPAVIGDPSYPQDFVGVAVYWDRASAWASDQPLRNRVGYARFLPNATPNPMSVIINVDPDNGPADLEGCVLELTHDEIGADFPGSVWCYSATVEQGITEETVAKLGDSTGAGQALEGLSAHPGPFSAAFPLPSIEVMTSPLEARTVPAATLGYGVRSPDEHRDYAVEVKVRHLAVVDRGERLALVTGWTRSVGSLLAGTRLRSGDSEMQVEKVERVSYEREGAWLVGRTVFRVGPVVFESDQEVPAASV